MSRQQKRQRERDIQKIENRLYSYTDCMRMMAGVLKQTQSQYNVKYSTVLATALSAPPYNFDSETVCGIIRLFFDQIEAVHAGAITEEQIKEEAAKLGVIIKDDGQELIVDINPIKTTKKKRGTKMKITDGNGKTKADLKEVTPCLPVSKTENEAEFLKATCMAMVEQFKNKNVAYGDSFGKQFQKYGPISALVRMSDKFNRLESLMMGSDNKVADERLEDTLVDMACYCLMSLYEIEMRKVESLEKK